MDFQEASADMDNYLVSQSIKMLSDYLRRSMGKSGYSFRRVRYSHAGGVYVWVLGGNGVLIKVITISSDKYAGRFGFTEEEVFAACEQFLRP